MKTVRALRILVSVLCAVIITAIAAGSASAILLKLSIVADIQIGWLLMSMHLGVIIVWLGLTYLFGRFYCSTICPIGTIQDCASRSVRLTARAAERRRYSYAPPQNRLRVIILALFVAALAVAPAFAAKLEPSLLYAEAVGELTGRLAIASISSLTVTYAVMLIIVVTAIRSGRSWCNTMCPIGTLLGMASAYSVFHIDINTDLCTNCRRCADVCKSRCINLDDHTVDASRCVVCFDCTAVCPNQAITYTTERHKLSTPLMTKISNV